MSLFYTLCSPSGSAMARATLGLSYRDVAGLAKISYTAVWRYEAGDERVSIGTVRAITDVYLSQGIEFKVYQGS